MSAWIPSVLETMGFASSSNATPKRRATSEEHRSKKHSRRRYNTQDNTIDRYVAVHANPDQDTQETAAEDVDTSYFSLSDASSTSFANLLPVLPDHDHLAPEDKKAGSPTKAAPSSSSPSKPTPQDSTLLSPSAPWAPNTSPSHKWSNKHARELFASHPDPRTAILAEVQEPEYALRDVEISEGFEELKDLMCEFADAHFRFDVEAAPGKATVLSPAFFEQFSEETARVIGCVASGGPGGVGGWHATFVEPVKRMAVVCGIVGNVLVEQVFQHVFFGGREGDVDVVAGMQGKYGDEDGFVRNTHYATYIRSLLATTSSNHYTLPPNFANHVNHIVAALTTHLSPMLTLSPSSPSPSSLIPHLHTLVTHAGLLSLSMRADPHTVYHFAPIFKEEPFSRSRMECYNAMSMTQTNPHTPATDPGLRAPEQQRRAGLSEMEVKRARGDGALVQITVLDGVTAYRLGGWEGADSKVANVRYGRGGDAVRGVRERVLSKAWAYCRWGRARVFEDGKAGDDARCHGEAWEGGFREFVEVEGVRNWVVGKGKGKERARVVVEEDVQAQSDEEGSV